MLEHYRQQEQARCLLGLPALPLTDIQVHEITELLCRQHHEGEVLLDLLANRVEPGVGEPGRVKAAWLEKVAAGEIRAPLLDPVAAVHLLGRMGGGYNVASLIRLLDIEACAKAAAAALKGLIKIYETFDLVADLAKSNSYARDVIWSWAAGEWFTGHPPLPDSMPLAVYKVDGEINTDDFSPGNQAQSRADIPLHATFLGIKRFPDGIETIADMRRQGRDVAFAGDVVGTGSSRKSAVNSLAWHIGIDIPSCPNKRRGGVVLGGTIAPIFKTTARDAGVLALECDVSFLSTGDSIVLDLENQCILTAKGRRITLELSLETLLDEYRAGGRLNLIIGRDLTRKACAFVKSEIPGFARAQQPAAEPLQGYTLAQKLVGRACGRFGVQPGMVCEPKITTVGSQDTTGPMTVQEIEELACLRLKTDLFLQSFCHTAAYPKKSDIEQWRAVTEAIVSRGGVALKPGDGVIHSWLNRMLVPDTVGTGGDSHTRFPLGISFPAGSGLVAFAGVLGFMPLEMPPSVLVRFHGRRRSGITVRDMVNVIPRAAMERGLLTVCKQGKKNIFAGAILEIEGIDDLSVEEAFELSDASAERSAAACTVALSPAAVIENVRRNAALLKRLVADGYGDAATLTRRITMLEQWLAEPELLKRDTDARFLAVLEIDLDTIREPLLACPNDPDDVRLLSEVAGTAVDEAFIGSCMTHIRHLQTAARLFDGEDYAASRVWIAPSTRMDRDTIRDEGAFSVFAQVGCRIEVPGCSLCMGNQARVRQESTVVSTSTRNFDNRLGDGAKVFLASTELTAVSGLLGRLPTTQEYFAILERKLAPSKPQIGSYRGKQEEQEQKCL